MVWMSIEGAARSLGCRPEELESRVTRGELGARPGPQGERRVWIPPGPGERHVKERERWVELIEKLSLEQEAQGRHRAERQRWADVLAQLESQLASSNEAQARLRSIVARQQRALAEGAQARCTTATLQQENDRLRTALNESPAPRLPEAPSSRRRRTPKRGPLPADKAALLDRLSAVWPHSDRELARQGVVPHGFLTRLRSGRGLGSARTWERLERFVASLESAARAA
jgi:hypothetical protein